MNIKKIRELIGEGAFWVLIIAGFFILIQNYLHPTPCCTCDCQGIKNNSINVLTNVPSPVE